jgi:hypothetical protein
MNFEQQKIEITQIIIDLRERGEYYAADEICVMILRAMTASKTDMGHAHGILDRLIKSEYLKSWLRRIRRMTTRKQALAIIRYEYASHGKETCGSMRAYIENRISFESRLKAVREGLSIYNKKGDDIK